VSKWILGHFRVKNHSSLHKIRIRNTSKWPTLKSDTAVYQAVNSLADRFGAKLQIKPMQKEKQLKGANIT
jgi:hypothetical protein